MFVRRPARGPLRATGRNVCGESGSVSWSDLPYGTVTPLLSVGPLLRCVPWEAEPRTLIDLGAVGMNFQYRVLHCFTDASRMILRAILEGPPTRLRSVAPGSMRMPISEGPLWPLDRPVVGTRPI